MNDKKTVMVKFLICAGLLFIVYLPTFIWMWDRWFAEESYYGHGILIPFISGYIVWQRRNELKVKPAGNSLGLVLIGVAILAHIACKLLEIGFISGLSFIIALWGLILYFFGREMVNKLIFPLFFLLAMVPAPLALIASLTVKLKLFAAQCATFILNRICFPSLLDGSIIRMPGSFTEVGAPCSGLRSLISLITLGLIFAYSLKVSYFKKAIILLSSVPLAIITNVMRIIMISIVNDLYGEKVAMGFFHDFTGFLVFFFAFLGLFAIGRLLEPRKVENEE